MIPNPGSAALGPLVVSYGMGEDSTAMLIGLSRRGICPDLILFADTGDEKPETYAYRDVIDPWLKSVCFPPITVVRYVPKRFKHGPYSTLEGNCIQNRTLPSLAFNRHACSQKWKGAPMDKYVREYAPFQPYRDRGIKVRRAIGYDDGPKDSKRGKNFKDDDEFTFVFPLREWGWARERCGHEIQMAGLPLPVKSACFYCPATQKCELIELAKKHPDLARRAVEMEDRASPNLKKIAGLWGTGVKGVRDPSKRRPGSWRQFLDEEGLITWEPQIEEDTTMPLPGAYREPTIKGLQADLLAITAEIAVMGGPEKASDALKAQERIITNLIADVQARRVKLALVAALQGNVHTLRHLTSTFVEALRNTSAAGEDTEGVCAHYISGLEREVLVPASAAGAFVYPDGDAAGLAYAQEMSRECNVLHLVDADGDRQ